MKIKIYLVLKEDNIVGICLKKNDIPRMIKNIIMRQQMIGIQATFGDYYVIRKSLWMIVPKNWKKMNSSWGMLFFDDKGNELFKDSSRKINE